MKKILLTFSLVASILATSVVPAFAAGDLTLTSTKDAANVGEEFVVTATMDTSNGVKTIGFKIAFDPNDFELGVSEESKALEAEYGEYIGTDDFPTLDSVTQAMLGRDSYVSDEYANTYAGYATTKNLGTATIGYEEKDGLGKIGFAYGVQNAKNALNKIDEMVLGGAVLKVKTTEKKEATVYIVEADWSDKNNTGYKCATNEIKIALNGYTGEQAGGSVDADPVNDGEVFTDAANAQAVAFSATVGSDASGKTGRWYATIGTKAMKTKDAFVVPNLVGNAKYGLIYKGTETISNVSLKWE